MQPTDPLIGMTLGSCTITRPLGLGGMARVYLGRQEHLDRVVAIKVLPSQYALDPGFVERFQTEARAMASLRHPHIVTVHDAGEHLGRLYIVMEYLAGGALSDRMTQPLSDLEIARVIDQVASALSYAHERGIIHCDVKPANVLLDTDGRAVLSDFGVARMMASMRGASGRGLAVGTPAYMSPEQCAGSPLDQRSDIYALGVVLYALLVGHPPFRGESFEQFAHAHLYEPAPPPAQLNPHISPAVQAVVLKALAKDPADRFQRASELGSALELAIAAQQPMSSAASGAGWTSGSLAAQRAARPASVSVSPEVLCPRCGSRNPASNQFCTNCGQAFGSRPGLPMRIAPSTAPPRSCAHCGTPNPANNRFCTACGESL